MENCFVINNKALILFSLDNIEIRNKEKERLIWAKLIKSFGFDRSVVLNLLFIDHPVKNYIGLSLETNDMKNLKEKVKRYSEGLAYLLVYHFPKGEIQVLDGEECENIITNLAFSKTIPVSLTSPLGGASLNGRDHMRVVFTRVMNPGLILDKFFEFYSKVYEEEYDSLETRVGMKPKCDERILEVLQSAHLTYSFTIHSSEESRIKDIEESNGRLIPRKRCFYREFAENIGVPEVYVDKVREARSTSDIFDNPDILLVSPEKVAKFILGYL